MIFRNGIFSVGSSSAGGGAGFAGVSSIEGLSGIIDLDSTNGGLVISTLGQTIILNPLFSSASGALLQALANQSSVQSVEGLSGIIDIDSPDDSINIATNGQVIEITIPTSGAPSGASYILVNYNDNNHLVDARILSATSGIRLDDKGPRSGSGIVVKLDFDNEPQVNQVLSWNGQKLQWTAQSGTGGGGASNNTKIAIMFTPASGTVFDVAHNLNTLDFVWSMWETSTNPIISMLPINVIPSGLNHATIVLETPVSGKIVICGMASDKSVNTFSISDGNVFILNHNLNTLDFVWSMWDTTISPIRSMLPNNIAPSGLNHAIVTIETPTNGKVVFLT